MKKYLIGLVLDTTFDMLIMALQKRAMQTTSSVDDRMITVLAEEKDAIVADIKRSL